MLSCSWKQGFGVDCMGCGMQRSIIQLFKGEFMEAFKMYPAIYTLIVMFVFLGFHLKFDFNKGGRILIYLFSINALIILTNFILKITH
ncbi:MAG: hypothetical protein COA67_10420 [Lutibacter sp.]|nr:MAG: hypothetical protein COA67_10420 [Lutibacter sp.]